MSDDEYSDQVFGSDSDTSDQNVDPTLFPNPPRLQRSPTPRSQPHTATMHKRRQRKGDSSPADSSTAQGNKKKKGRPPGKYGKYNVRSTRNVQMPPKVRKGTTFFLPYQLRPNTRNTRTTVMPKRIYARTKRVYKTSPKNLFYDTNLMFRPSILTSTISRTMVELRSKHNRVTSIFHKRFPSMVSTIGSNKSSANRLFLKNLAIGNEYLDFLRGWFHKTPVKMPGCSVDFDRIEIPRFDDVISLAMGSTQFGVDILGDNPKPCPKLSLQDLQLLISHDFDIGAAMRQINKIRSNESRYQLRYYIYIHTYIIHI